VSDVASTVTLNAKSKILEETSAVKENYRLPPQIGASKKRIRGGIFEIRPMTYVLGPLRLDGRGQPNPDDAKKAMLSCLKYTPPLEISTVRYDGYV
jgi:hypothetical protein